MDVSQAKSTISDLINNVSTCSNHILRHECEQILKTAERVLSNRIGPVQIEDLCNEFLVFIGSHSNQRFGTTAETQDIFFSKFDEWKTIPLHISIACWNKKNMTVSYAHIVKFGVFSDFAFAGIRKAQRIRFGPSQLTEQELKAVGSVYLVCKIIKSEVLVMDDTIIPLLKLLLDSSDPRVLGSIGGRVGKKVGDKFLRAREIVEDLIANYPQKNTSVLSKKAIKLFSMDADFRGSSHPSPRWFREKIRAEKNCT